jgi:hypothetical protein
MNTTEIEAGIASGPSRRPTNFVAGLIDNRDELEAARHDLIDAGFDPASIGVRYGQAGIDGFESRPRSWLGEMLSDESAHVDAYVEELRLGHHAIRIPLEVPLDDQRSLVRHILRTHGAHHLISRGRWTFEADPD